MSNHLAVAVLVVAAAICGTSLAAEGAPEPLWKSPPADFSKYSKVLVKPLDLGDVKIVRPPWATEDPEDWTLEVVDTDQVQAVYRDAMTGVLEAGNGYEVVHNPGPDVIEVKVEILSIMPYLRPGSEGVEDGMRVQTLGSGELKATAVLRDSASRDLLVLIEGERAVGQDYKDWNAANNIDNLDKMFQQFALRLRIALDQIHRK